MDQLSSLPSGWESFVFVLKEEALGFWMELMGVSVGNSQRSEQWRQFSVGMQIAGSEGHGALAVAYESAGSGSD